MSERCFAEIQSDGKAFFHNNVDFCVGTGRMGLALTKEYLDELAFVQAEIGFRHIRGHGLFCDDMAIYQEYEKDGEIHAEYNFTYLDRVMDAYRSVGLKPFLELGFMPEKLARGTQTVFYWKGNTTPPKSYEGWTALVQATLRHLMERYGAEEVVTWPVEVWNEPNLPGFWEHADMQEYFRLFHVTFDAVKEVDPRFRVGGPAVCGGSDRIWIQSFLEYCQQHQLAVDMITRHHYTVEFPLQEGHYAYHRLMDPEAGFSNLQSTRDITDSFEAYRGLPIHITEFNSSYTPLGVIHDTNLNAAYMARQLSRLGDMNESYSYWTFGDVFEEQGVPYTPFHGGFGLVTQGCIPKPTFWTFSFFKRLQEQGGTCVHKDDTMVVTRGADGSYRGILWNPQNDCAAEDKCREFMLSMEADAEAYTLVTKLVDEEVCNPLKIWHDLGEPAHLNDSQLKLLRQSAVPMLQTSVLKTEGGRAVLNQTLTKNAVLYFELTKHQLRSDRGYDYHRVTEGEMTLPYRYRNVFRELGKSEEEIEARLQDIVKTFFEDEEERIYHPVGEDMGYLEDTGNHDARTEGMSYGMMMCVQLNKKEEFDRIWKWAMTYMYMEEGENEGYFAWSCATDGTKNAYGPAPDGEEFFAMALFFAAHRWGNGQGIYNYEKYAREILKACIHKGENGRPGQPMWNHDNHQILFVPGSPFTDPSYHLPHFYELFALWADEADRPFWREAVKASREYLAQACHPETGMSAEYANFDATPVRKVFAWGRHDWFYSDAYRTAANIGLDYAWFGVDKGQRAAAERLQYFLGITNREDPFVTYEVDGTRLDQLALHPVGLLATTAQGALAVREELTDPQTEQGKLAKEWVERFWNEPLRKGDRRYYDNCLYLFAFLALSGKYRIW